MMEPIIYADGPKRFDANQSSRSYQYLFYFIPLTVRQTAFGYFNGQK